MVALAGQRLNAILQDLCQNYDFDVASGVTPVVFTVSSGPYSLPNDYLRSRKGMVFYLFQGVPYSMNTIDIDEYDLLVQQAGFADFPRDFATDMSTTPPSMYFWPPPSIPGVVATVRYYKQMPDIPTPETSVVVPWFPNQNYLITRLAGEMMQLTGDDRADAFLSSNEETHPLGAGVVLRRYLEMKDDPEGRTNRVQLDRRIWGNNFSRLNNTKLVGWTILLLAGNILAIAGEFLWMTNSV